MTYNVESVKSEIIDSMRILNTEYMPTKKDLESISRSGLSTRIGRLGGYQFFREEMGLYKKPLGSNYKGLKNSNPKYSDDNIEKLIITISNGSGFMPTSKEVREYCGDTTFDNAIKRSGGYFEWADKLKLKPKESETVLGVSYQNECYELLIQRGYSVTKTEMLSPYDLLVNKHTRIDVKCGRAYDLRGTRCHTFGLSKPYPMCDIYVCFALNEKGDKIERCFVIPSKYLKMYTLSVGKESKYNKYIDRFDYIDKYLQFYETI